MTAVALGIAVLAMHGPGAAAHACDTAGDVVHRSGGTLAAHHEAAHAEADAGAPAGEAVGDRPATGQADVVGAPGERSDHRHAGPASTCHVVGACAAVVAATAPDVPVPPADRGTWSTDRPGGPSVDDRGPEPPVPRALLRA